jgi:hypothetical protein
MKQYLMTDVDLKQATTPLSAFCSMWADESDLLEILILLFERK